MSIEAEKQAAIDEVISERDKDIKKAQDECNVKLAVLASGLGIGNFIYYTHCNEGAFNWNTNSYNKAITPEQFDMFLKTVDLSNLPEGITFKLK